MNPNAFSVLTENSACVDKYTVVVVEIFNLKLPVTAGTVGSTPLPPHANDPEPLEFGIVGCVALVVLIQHVA